VSGLRLCLLLAACLVLTACEPETPRPDEGPRVADLLGDADNDGFARALPGRPLVFPADHGPHPDYRAEWWYFTGNLEEAAGRHFGFQLTIFRFAVAGEATPRDSDWASRQIWMGHLAVSDPAGGRFVHRERLSRGALGLAGARAEPLAVWLDDWRIESTGPDFLPLRLVAADEGLRLDLTLTAGKPRVLQGKDGLSAKGPEPGNASWYYSYMRLPASGEIAIGNDTFAVSGQAWLDREWSTSALGEGVEGWDWFALQFDDQSELMVYRLRREDGTADVHSAGTFVDPSGQVTRLAVDDFDLTPTRRWTSPESGATYPVGWTVAVPRLALSVEVEPWQDDQEMNVAVRYWEGAMRVRGTRAGRPVAGHGYLELAGYRPPTEGVDLPALPRR
jgi:predicted secreted hydrolase